MKPSIENPFYYVTMLTKKGKVKYDLTPILTSLKIYDSEGELATKANLSFMNVYINNSWLTGLFTVGDVIQISADNGGGKKAVGTFTIWERGYDRDLKKIISVTAYDSKLIYLQKSEDVRVYAKGKDTKSIVSDICKAWGVSLSYQYSTTTHTMKQWRGTRLSEMILECLEDVRKATGKKYVLYSDNNKLVISGYGQNKTVYEFDARKNVFSTSESTTLEGVVTKINIYSHADEGVRNKLETSVTGRVSDYGTLQQVIIRSDNKKLADCKTEANQTIKDDGQAKVRFTLEAKDLPWLKKGDVLQVTAGNMVGKYYALSVMHNCTDGTMSVEVER